MTELFFMTGQTAEAEAFIKRWHYSRRYPTHNCLVGSLHEPGGLFGDQGRMVAVCCFSFPGTPWRVPVIELSRLARAEYEVSLTRLIALTVNELKQKGCGVSLLVSYADPAHGHAGGVYRAASWIYCGLRKPRRHGFLIDGEFLSNRSVDDRYGTTSEPVLKKILGNRISPAQDQGKHLFIRALNKRGIKQAKSIGLIS